MQLIRFILESMPKQKDLSESLNLKISESTEFGPSQIVDPKTSPTLQKETTKTKAGSTGMTI